MGLDGLGVDEIIQCLSGSNIVFEFKAECVEVLTLHVNCEANQFGWLVTYNGSKLHIGSLSQAHWALSF